MAWKFPHMQRRAMPHQRRGVTYPNNAKQGMTQITGAIHVPVPWTMRCRSLHARLISVCSDYCL